MRRSRSANLMESLETRQEGFRQRAHGAEYFRGSAWRGRRRGWSEKAAGRDISVFEAEDIPRAGGDKEFWLISEAGRARCRGEQAGAGEDAGGRRAEGTRGEARDRAARAASI